MYCVYGPYSEKLGRKRVCIGWFALPVLICKPITSLFVCVEVLLPSQPNGVMSSVVSLPNHTFTGQA